MKGKIKLAADVSANGLGAVIFHVYEDGSGRPIAYASHTLICQIQKRTTV